MGERGDSQPRPSSPSPSLHPSRPSLQLLPRAARRSSLFACLGSNLLPTFSINPTRTTRTLTTLNKEELVNNNLRQVTNSSSRTQDLRRVVEDTSPRTLVSLSIESIPLKGRGREEQRKEGSSLSFPPFPSFVLLSPFSNHSSSSLSFLLRRPSCSLFQLVERSLFPTVRCSQRRRRRLRSFSRLLRRTGASFSLRDSHLLRVSRWSC